MNTTNSSQAGSRQSIRPVSASEIPITYNRSNLGFDAFGDSRDRFVGSPEQQLPLGAGLQTPAGRNLFNATYHDQHPRHVSSPVVTRPRASSSATSLLLPNRSQFRMPTTSTPGAGSEQPWSVFGSLMENEGPLHGNATLPRRKSSRSTLGAQSYLNAGSSHDPDGGDSTQSSGVYFASESLNQDPLVSTSFTGLNVNTDDFVSRERENRNPLPTNPISTEPDDEDYDSDESASSFPTCQNGKTLPRQLSPSVTVPWYSPQHLPSLSPLYRNILKCGVAYFLASLFTFNPYLSSLLRDIVANNDNEPPGKKIPSPTGHMVATVAVYFNPAKTVGAMFEADTFCLMGLVYSSLICLSSMSVFWWLELKPGWEWLADALVVLWIGVGMSGVAWMKVWMAKPTFNTACSMTAILIFIVIVKEGGLETLAQVSLIVLIGAVISNLVCTLMWSQSATANLQSSVTKTLDSFATVLSMITSTFLLEDGLEENRGRKNVKRMGRRQKLQNAVEAHQASFTGLKRSLDEAYSEWFNGGPYRPSTSSRPGSYPFSPLSPSTSYTFGQGGMGNLKRSMGKAYEDAVDCMNRLAQHLNGLRSGTRLQYELTKAVKDGKIVLKGSRWGRKGTNDGLKDVNGKRKAVDGDVSGLSNEDGLENGLGEEDEETKLLQMFGLLVDDLGPPLKALSFTCTTSLKRLREALFQSPGKRKEDMILPQDFHELVDGLERALFTFESTSNQAMLRLYRRGNAASEGGFGASRESLGSGYVEENSMLTGGDNEQVFVVYFFIFTLQEFAHELVSLVDAMSRICAAEAEQKARRKRWRFLFERAAEWLFGWFGNGAAEVRLKRPSIKRSISALVIPKRHTHYYPFPKIQPHAPNTIQTPPRSRLTFIGRIKQTLWAISARLRESDTKYAIKAGMATAMLAAPAFVEQTRPVFMEYRGEWALISFFVVISPTIGATNFLSLHRILGTIFGAGVAAGIFSLFSENAVVLSIFGFLFSLPCFYFIVAKPVYATSARFVLLTYNLTCLYCFNLRQVAQVDVSAVNIAFHRSASVTVGVLWAAIISRFWWPAEARRELSKALGEFCLNLGWLYTRLVAANSFAPEVIEVEDELGVGEGSSMLSSKPFTTKLNNSIQEFMAMELHLQIKLIELEGLLAQTVHEPRLKGPFPVDLYRSILVSLQTILDKLHSMRCVTTKEEWFTTVREDFVLPVNRERREMVGNIILYFSTLASAFRLKAPLPPYLPPAEQARQRLVDAIRKLDVVKNRDVKGSRQLLFFAYALTMQGVTRELDYLGQTLQNAFGVIGQTPEEFEALFRGERMKVLNGV